MATFCSFLEMRVIVQSFLIGRLCGPNLGEGVDLCQQYDESGRAIVTLVKCTYKRSCYLDPQRRFLCKSPRELRRTASLLPLLLRWAAKLEPLSRRCWLLCRILTLSDRSSEIVVDRLAHGRNPNADV